VNQKPTDYAAAGRLANLFAQGAARSPESFLPIIGEENTPRVRVEVIEASDKLTVHIFPQDPRHIQAIMEFCKVVLPRRFPDSKGDCHPVKDNIVEPSVCIVMPAHSTPPWAANFYRTEFMRLLEKTLGV
jgi:hypothetical protein